MHKKCRLSDFWGEGAGDMYMKALGLFFFTYEVADYVKAFWILKVLSVTLLENTNAFLKVYNVAQFS